MRKRKDKIKGKKILFIAQDPGGFNSLVSVIKKLKEKIKFKVFLANESREIARKNKIKYVDFTGTNKAGLNESLERFRPDLIVVATSTGYSLEKKAISWAKINKVNSIAIIDFWSNYKVRFSTPETFDLKFLPEAICVIDRIMKKKMIREGFDERKLYITGNPFFDNFKTAKGVDGKYILFVDQAFSEVFSRADKKKANSGVFNEVKIFSDFIKVFQKLKMKEPILIAFHPKSKKRNKYNGVMAESNLKIIKVKDSTFDLIGGAKIVIGINTAILFQAAMMGKITISYQPGANNNNDPLISNRLGLSQSAYSFKMLEKKIKNSFQNRSDKNLKNKRDSYIRNNSTNKFIKVINNFLT